VVWLVLWVASCASAGWLALSIGSRRAVPAPDRAILGLPVGLVLVGILQFLLNWLLGIPVTRWSTLALVIGLNLALFGGSRLAPSWISADWRNVHLDWHWAWLAAPVSLLVLLVIALQFPHPIQGWDFYAYHWHYTRLVVETGNLPKDAAPTIMNSQYAYPPLVFLIYAQISVLLGGLSEIGPRVLPVLFVIAAILVTARVGSVMLRLAVPAALIAGAFTIWQGDFYNGAVLQENTDTAGMFFTIAAVYWLLRRDLAPASRIVGGAIFIGGAYWARYDGLALFLVLTAVVAFTVVRERIKQGAWLNELAVGVGALAGATMLAAPHLLRNFQLWGNPIYPAFARLIGGHLIDSWVISNVLPYSTPSPFHGLAGGWWLHPLAAFPATGPALIFLAFALPLSVIRLRAGHPEAFQLWLAAALYVGFYLLFMRVPDDGDTERHLLPVVALAAPLAGMIMQAIWSAGRAGVLATCGLIGMVAWFALENPRTEWGVVNLLLVALALVALLVQASRIDTRLINLRLASRLSICLLPFLILFASATTHANGPDGQGMPESALLQSLPSSSRYLTFDNRVELLGGNAFSGDDPALQHFYQDQLSGEAAVAELKRLNIAEIYWSIPPPGSGFPPNPLIEQSPLFRELDDPSLFQRIFYRYDDSGGAAIYALR
jgi:hypothetical protein